MSVVALHLPPQYLGKKICLNNLLLDWRTDLRNLKDFVNLVSTVTYCLPPVAKN